MVNKFLVVDLILFYIVETEIAALESCLVWAEKNFMKTFCTFDH